MGEHMETTDLDEDPFKASTDRYVQQVQEFRHFREKARIEFEKFRRESSEFKWMDRHFTGYVDEFVGEAQGVMRDRQIPTLQFWFGNRALRYGRVTQAGSVASEHGAALVYSFGPTGEIAVMLYPASGDLARVNESSILLRVGHFSAGTLLAGLQSDLQKWARYAKLTSIDSNPTWSERLRLGYMRATKTVFIDNVAQPTLLSKVLSKLVSESASALYSGVIGFVVGLLISRMFE